jgi:phosphoglycerate kinase
MKTITEAGDLKDKKVLVRVDWNVPVQDGKVADDFRIRHSLPTIEFLEKEGAEIIILSHYTGEGNSLAPIVEHAKKYLPKLVFNGKGKLQVLENLRHDPGEKKNSVDFAKKLAKLGDIFVNEAFSASHRDHASIVSLPKLLPSYAGLRLVEEVNELTKAFYPKHPFLFIIGGAKFDTKIPLVKKFLSLADDVFVGGALANDFFRAMGRDIGASVVSDNKLDLADFFNSDKIILPEDTIDSGGKIMDAGPLSLEKLKEKIEAANLILWNGPLGHCESGYKVGTHTLAKLIANSGKYSIVGGGDTLAAIEELKLLDRFSFVSTGGGAMLDFLAAGTLPGIEALK